MESFLFWDITNKLFPKEIINKNLFAEASKKIDRINKTLLYLWGN